MTKKKLSLFWHTKIDRGLMDSAEARRVSLGMSKTGAVEMMVRAFTQAPEAVRSAAQGEAK